MHNCKALLEKVILALDGELTTAEEQQLLKEVEECPSCFKKYHIEKSFKDFLASKIERKCASPQCIESIRARIQQM
jgi:anti-sigma factor (TIGR02949 family)